MERIGSAWLSLLLPLSILLFSGCQTAEEAFVEDKLPTLCDESYWICDAVAGCVLDADHYVSGVFPGSRNVVVVTGEEKTRMRVQLFLTEMESPGTELLVQLYEPNCTLETSTGISYLVDTDIFQEAGDNRTLQFELTALSSGEHLLELYSDARVGYLMTVDVEE